MMLPGMRKTGKHLLRTRNVSEQNRKHFLCPYTKFVSATNVARAGKRGNICVGNNVLATMCLRLPGPLGIDLDCSPPPYFQPAPKKASEASVEHAQA